MKSVLCCCCFITIFFVTSRAQDATISSFLLTSKDQQFDLWDDDFTGEFVYENSKHKTATMRTVDTLFSYTRQLIGSKLGLTLEKQDVEEYSNQDDMLGRISGFPQETIKKAAKRGNYNKIIEISVTAEPDPVNRVELVGITKVKYQFQMSVSVRVHDQDGGDTKKYFKITKLDEPVKTKETRGKPNHLSGNEFFNLFAAALNNTMQNEK